MKQPVCLYDHSLYAHCPNAIAHTSGPVDMPTADYIYTSERCHEDTGYIEVFACTVCGTVFGLDRNRFFTPAPDECAS